VLAVLAMFGAAVVWLGQLGSGRAVVVAAVRAVARLAAISLVITAILNSGWLTGLFVALMFIVAAITAARIGVRPHVRWVAAAIAGVCLVLVRCGAVGTDRGGAHRGDPDRRRDDGNLAGGVGPWTSYTRHGEFEAALTLGFLTRTAALEVARPSAGHAFTRRWIRRAQSGW
jgi:putative ABC transport system permease protein